VLKTLGIAYIEPKPVTDNNIGGKLYRVQVGAYSDINNAKNMQAKLKAAGFESIIV
jgi:cell division protein FtsN